MSTPHTEKNHDEFDYEETKRAFYQEVGYVILVSKLGSKAIRNREKLENLIWQMKYDRKPCETDFNLQCVVLQENDQDTLFHFISASGKPSTIISYKQVISIDEIFYVLSELHMLEPLLPLIEIIKKLSNCYILPDFIKLFWKACRSCRNMKRRGQHSQYHIHKYVGEITLFDMMNNDNSFSQILMYIERSSNFVILRPLKTDRFQEVAYEMLNIFCDFGPPQYLCSNNKKYFLKVLTILASIKLPFTLPQMYRVGRDHKLSIMICKVKVMIADWMDKWNNKNWAIGAHIVQWIMNTNEVLDTYIRSKVVDGPLENPYQALFSQLPHTDQVNFHPERSPTEFNKNEEVCSQCYQQVYKIYKCYDCLAICHFLCCRRIIQETEGIRFLVNKCLSCDKM